MRASEREPAMARPASASDRTDGSAGLEFIRAADRNRRAMTTSTLTGGPDREHRPDWRDDAACGDVDPELFFPDGDIVSMRLQLQVKAAKAICRGCPVSATCLSWALASGQEFGIWGGLTEDERHRLQRRLSRRGGLAAAPAA